MRYRHDYSFLDAGMRLQIPDGRLSAAVRAARRHLLVGSGSRPHDPFWEAGVPPWGSAVAAVALVPPPGAAATFHGRDLFAPAAARLAAGEPLAALGEPFDPATLVAPDLPPPRVEPGRLSAEVVGVDRYGNVQLLAGAEHLAAAGLERGERI